MNDTAYYGWTNYETWRVNLEMLDGIDPREMDWHKFDKYDLAPILKDYCDEILAIDTKEGLALDYARAFLDKVNFREIAKFMLEQYCGENDKPFHVVGIDEDDGNATILEQFDNSGEARDWMRRYAAKENAGNWKRLEVLDTRDECAEIVASWEAAA